VDVRGASSKAPFAGLVAGGIAGALGLGVLVAAYADGAPLPALGADASQTSVSGLSSGAFMTVQLQVAYSATLKGAGVVAGGPYYCAQNNIAFTYICMGQSPLTPPNPSVMVGSAKAFAITSEIDSLSNLKKRPIYVFSGTDDTVVKQPAVDATVGFFKGVGVPESKIKYVNSVPAGHAVITPAFGNDCSANADPYISHCQVNGQGYDQAGALLEHIYGTLQPRVASTTGQLLEFDQSVFGSPAMPAALAPHGFVYVPSACSGSGVHCRVHVAIHGCLQSYETVGNKFVTDTGYNEWADTNQLIVLYPQVNKSVLPVNMLNPLSSNPQGCWDWWGYSGSNYAWKSGVQMTAIMGMVKQLSQPVGP
jgi:hypothetical protein